jgi:SAM-dependent methyltransferase
MTRRRTPFSYEWLSARIVASAARRIASEYGRGAILDVGCGEKPYRELFTNATSYVGLEHPASLHSRNAVDVFGSADRLPFSDESFDVVVSFEVLEHLERPDEALREMSRVLRPGGHCVVFVPFIYHLHEYPRDFFRYTPYGLAELFKRAGFGMKSVEHNSGFWETAAILTCNYLEKYQQILILRPFVSLILAVVQLVGMGLQWIFGLVERGDRIERFAYHYVAIGLKPLRTVHA